MRKQEFLETLRKKLSGNMSSYNVEDNIRYYDDYISGQVLQGKAEEQVIEEIGSPLLVAKTIIETQGVSAGQSNNKNVNHYSEDNNAGSKGFHAGFDQQGLELRYGKWKLNTWYWKLLAIIIVVAILLVIISIVGSIVSFVLPIVLPVLIIFLAVSIFTGGRRR